MEIELKTKNLQGFTKKIAKDLLNNNLKADKHYWRWCEKQGIRQGYAQKGYAKENYTDKINYLNTETGQEETLKQFKRIKKAIKERRLVLTCVGGLSWGVRIVENNKVEGIGLIYQKTLCSYPMNYEKQAFTMACYGTSRPLEIILAFGYNLGLDFHDIPQNQQII